MNKTYMRVISWILIFSLITPFEAIPQNEGTAPATFTKEEIAQMVAPIALYPDSLVAQILMASTYPLDVVEADRWVKQNPNLKGDSLDAALKDKNWDVSVKSLCHFPDVLSAMSQNLDKTTKLGDAVLGQQKDVMDVIQELRAKAKAQGNLKTTEQQTVSVDPADPQVIVIQPANPQVVYVPSYNPAVVYGSWGYPAYPPYAYYPGAALAGAAIGFGVGLAVGAAWGGWSNCNWGGGNINVNYNRTNNFNRTNINNRVGNQNWQHNSANRRGVAYRNNATAQRFGQSPTRSMESRQSRGYGGGTGGQSLQQRKSQTGGMGQQGFQQRGSQTGGMGKQSRQQGQLQQSRGGGSSYGSTRGGGQNAFSGAGNGNSTRMASQRGQVSRSQSYGGGGSRGGGSRGGGGGSRGGGGRGGGRGR